MAVNDLTPYGLADVAAFELTDEQSPTYATGINIPCAQTLGADEQVNTSILEGDDEVCAVKAIMEMVEIEIEHGGLPMDLYAMLKGATQTDSGTGSGEKSILDLTTDDVRPYFGIIAQVIGDTSGDVQAIFYKCKLVGGGGLAFEKGEFHTGTLTVQSIKGPSGYDWNPIYRVVNAQTAGSIDTTWTNNTVHKAA